MSTTIRRSAARRALTPRLVAGLAILTLAAAGCSGDSKKDADEPTPSASESASTSPSPSASSTPGAAGRFDLDAAVTITRNPVFRAFTTDDQVLTLDRDGVTSHALPDLYTEYVVVPPDGANPMDALVDEDTGQGYLLTSTAIGAQGTSVGRNAFVVTRFDADTGDVDSEARVSLRGSSTQVRSAAQARLRGVVGSIAVVDSWVTVGDAKVHTGLAIDLDRKRLVWQRSGLVLAATPRAVLVSRGTPTAPASIVGLDPGSGRTRWSTLEGTVDANLVAADDRHVVLARTGPFVSMAIQTVDLRTGRAVAGRTIDSSSWLCRPATRSVAVCLLPQRRVIGWGVQRNKQIWALPTRARYAPVVTSVADGVVYGMVGDRWVALDARSGKDLESGVGGALITANEFGGLFRTGTVTRWLPDVDHLPRESASATESTSPTESPSAPASS
ncbi:MAG: hypothetical protein U0R80_01365 [Nocardioidaceae bacterium]